MNPLRTEFMNLLRQFAQAISAAPELAQGAILKLYQPQFSGWASRARGADPSGLQGEIALALDIADQTVKHIPSLMVRVQAAIGGSAPAGAAASVLGGVSSGQVLIVLAVLALIFFSKGK